MLKKVFAGVLAVVMACAFMAACSGGSDDSGGSQPASAPPQQAPPAADNSGGNAGANDAYDVLSEDEYEDLMLQFRQVFEQQIGLLDEMLQEADSGFASEQDVVAWCQNFLAMKDAMESQADGLADALPAVPEYFMVAHTKVTIAVAAVCDALAAFEYAVDAYMDDDEDAFWDGLRVFAHNMDLAAELWHEAFADNSGGNAGANDANDVLSEDEYEDLMLQFRQVFEEQIGLLDEMLQEADSGFASEQDVVAWCQAFLAMKDAMESQADGLADALPAVPEYFMVAHTKVTIAVAAVCDALAAFEHAVDAYMDDDEDAFWDGLHVFAHNMDLAAELWHEAFA